MSYVVQLGGRSPRSNRVLIWISGGSGTGASVQYGDDLAHTADWHSRTSSQCDIEWAAGAEMHRELSRMRTALDLAEAAPALEPADLDEHERIAHDTSLPVTMRANHYIAAEQARERIDHAGIGVDFAGTDSDGLILLTCPDLEGTWRLAPEQHEQSARTGPAHQRSAHLALAAMRRALIKVQDTDRHWMTSSDHLLIAQESNSPFARRALHYVAAQHALHDEERSGRNYRYASTETRLIVRPSGAQTAEIVLSDLEGCQQLSIEVPTDRTELKALLQTLARAGGHEDLLGSMRPTQRSVTTPALVPARTGEDSVRERPRAQAKQRSAVREMAGVQQLITQERGLEAPGQQSEGLSLQRLAAAIAAVGIHAVDCSPSQCSCWVKDTH